MPLMYKDPFGSSIEHLDSTINPFVGLLREAAENGLPVRFGDSLRGTLGRWREIIAEFHGLDAAEAKSRKLIVEIGCHKGHTLLEMARSNPDILFIGIDITFKRVVTTAQRAKAFGLTNVFCIMANAMGLDQLFGPEELDGTIIFFPDPWVKKKKQAKNRLVDEAFCRRLGKVLAPTGFCWLKTDQSIYFAQAEAALAATHFTTTERHVELFKRDFDSVFENRFKEQNLPTYGAAWSFTGAPS